MFQSIHPPNARLTKQEMSNICYLAFPDSNSGCMGDTQFTIRLRRSPGQLETSPSSSTYGRHLPPKHFFWGYVYFRQVKDITLPRGYFQKVSILFSSVSSRSFEDSCFQSVVVLSTMSHVGMLGNICAHVADAFFTSGLIALEETYRLSKLWPDLLNISPTENLLIQLAGTKLETSLASEQSAVNSWLLPIAHHAQLLWELVLTAEPIIVFAANPTLGSQTVLALVG